MSTGKYLSLEEARKSGELKRFAKENPSKGDKAQFDELLGAMAGKPKTAEKAKEGKS